MATVNGYTAEHMDSLMAENIVDGSVSGDNLILEKRDGTTVNAGNVRGPAGTDGVDAAPGSVTVVADTTIVRTSDGRGKVATPTASEDAATKGYVDGLNSARVADNASRIADVSALDARLDIIEAYGLVARIGSNLNTTDGTLSASEVNIGTVTIPNPINGATYRVTAHANFIANASIEGRMRVKHGVSAVTGGTQIAEAAIDHGASFARARHAELVVEFTYTGTTGQANYNVVLTYVPVSGGTGRVSANGTRPAVLIVDQIV